MPKINVYSPHEDGRRIEVGWQPNGSVQVGTTLRNPVKVTLADAVPTAASASTAAAKAVSDDGDDWKWEGQFTALDRVGINNLIRALREARDKAFGRDE